MNKTLKSVPKSHPYHRKCSRRKLYHNALEAAKMAREESHTEPIQERNWDEDLLQSSRLTPIGINIRDYLPPSQISLRGKCLHTVLASLLVVLIITVSLPSSTDALGYTQSKCETMGWNSFPVWKYRAKPRWVPPMRTDRKMQREFLELFRGQVHYDSSEEDDYHLDIKQLQHIGDMCPKDAFFYSLSPKHLAAIVALSKMFVAQHSPPDVLRLARATLKSPYVNPKVWYYAIIAASQERHDMTGFKIAHPIDAMPDLFIPGPMLFDIMRKYRSAFSDRSDFHNSTTVHREKRSASSKKGGYKTGRNSTLTASIFENVELGQGHKKAADKRSKSSKLRSSHSSSKKTAKGKKKTAKADIPLDIPGNITEYRADTSMWKRAKIDAFDDCIVIDGSVGIHNGIENKLWYFREDMMVNQHHWYWHQEYPLNATLHRQRRAELFFYMHRNLIARYNAERVSNGMPFIRPFRIHPGAEIPSAYDSLLADVNSGKFWAPRPHGVRLVDILHKEDPDFEKNIFIKQYNQLYGRLKRSIEVGHLLTGPLKTLNIHHREGIEPLGNTIEASELNVNPLFYDAVGFHNTGHQLIGLSTDPKFKGRLPPGIMADTLTTMRDPEFYTYHAVVDDLFDMYKKQLAPYRLYGGEYPLRWDGIEILDIEVISQHGSHGFNQLRTFWANKRFELGPGVDRSIHNGDLEVDVCAVHLQHEPFDFKITVTMDPCAITKSNKGTVRIFLAPRYDEHGHRLPLKVQRRMMIHMDTFPVNLRVGKNEIYRRSFDSNVVTPWNKHIRQYANAPKNPPAADYCGCGWPTHLYIPKGSPEGMQFDVFVMLTSYDHDYVEEDPRSEPIPEPCNSPYLYCGVKFRKYPDAKPMGYPFDRLPYDVPIKCPKYGSGPLWSFLLCKFLQIFWYTPVNSLEEFVSHAPNMASTVVTITHLDKLVW